MVISGAVSEMLPHTPKLIADGRPISPSPSEATKLAVFSPPQLSLRFVECCVGEDGRPSLSPSHLSQSHRSPPPKTNWFSVQVIRIRIDRTIGTCFTLPVLHSWMLPLTPIT